MAQKMSRTRKQVDTECRFALLSLHEAHLRSNQRPGWQLLHALPTFPPSMAVILRGIRMDQVQFFSTEDVTPEQRLDYWNEVVAGTFLGCSVDVRDEETFAAQFWRCRLGDVGIVRARANCSKVSRWKGCLPDSSVTDRVTLHVLNVGHLEATQGS